MEAESKTGRLNYRQGLIRLRDKIREMKRKNNRLNIHSKMGWSPKSLLSRHYSPPRR